MLEGRIAYRFTDPTLLYEALTHRSAVDRKDEGVRWNERLEFLGDSVLGLAITRRLMSLGAGLPEGELSRMRAALVNEKALAALARTLDLGQFLVLGRGTAQSGGRLRDSLLADAMEALIGAMFQDGGLAPAEEFIARLYNEHFRSDWSHLKGMDYKTTLQEWTQEYLKITPTYQVLTAIGPDHAKEFTVQVLLAEQVYGEGKGHSKKSASQAAAQMAFAQIEKQHKESLI